MKYADARPMIKSGDLLAWTHRGWKTWHDFKVQMVRMFTRSEYSHVGVAWVVGGRVFALEAVMPLSRIYPLSKLGDFYLIPSDASWKPSTEQYALDHIGKEYSQLAAMAAPFKAAEKDRVDQCAAYTIQVLAQDGINLGYRAVPALVVGAALRRGKPLYSVEAA